MPGLDRLPIHALRVICTQRHNATIGDVHLASNRDGTVLVTTVSEILFCSREILFLLFFMKSKQHLLKNGYWDWWDGSVGKGDCG